MATIKFSSGFFYGAQRKNDGDPSPNISRVTRPVNFFWVFGGAERKIDLASTSIAAVTSELEQARMYKNLFVILADISGIVREELIAIAQRELPVNLSLNVWAKSGSSLVSGFQLLQSHGSIKTPPVHVGYVEKSVLVEFAIPSATLSHSSGGKIEEF